MEVKVHNGCFSYRKGSPLLQNISFSLKGGDMLAILGRNGVGKTTLLNCLIGISPWNEGYTTFDGKRVDGYQGMESIAYVPQVRHYLTPYDVLDFVCLGRTKKMGYFSMPSSLDKEIAHCCLDDLGISDLAHMTCGQLSGGQLQLAYLARAMASEPELIILDEPENHLDFRNQLHIFKKISELVEKKKIICIVNTHSPENTLRFFEYTLMLGNREYVFGKTQEVLTRENIKKYFGVDGGIIDLAPCGHTQKAFVITEEG